MAIPTAFSPPRPLPTSLFPIFHPCILTSSLSLFPTFSCPPKRLSLSVSSPQYTTIKAASATAADGFDPKLGISVYKPKSYEVLVTDAANSLFYALNDGKTRLEIDFPPLPASISSYKGSSDEFSDANIQLSLAAVKKLQEKMETRACIVFPDKPEKRRATELFKAALDSIEGITISSLDDIPVGPVTTFFRSVRNTLDFDYDDENEGRWKSDEPPSIYIFINSSTRDLSVIEKKNLPHPHLPFFLIWNLTH